MANESSKDKLLNFGSFEYYDGKIKNYIDEKSSGITVDTVNGHTVESDVPANAKFTDTQRGIQDNLTSTSTTESLSANQGRILNSRMFQKQDAITDTTLDWNTITALGIYKVSMESKWGDATTVHSPNAYNSKLHRFGILLVFNSANNTGENRTAQIYIPHSADTDGTAKVVKRTMNNANWTNWTAIGLATDWDEIINKPLVSKESDGLMSSADKTKLNGIATGATKNQVLTFTTDVAVSDWATDTDGGYSCTKIVTGLLSTDIPEVDVALSTDRAAAMTQLAALECLCDGTIITGDDTVKLWCYNNKPTVAITVRLKVVR